MGKEFFLQKTHEPLPLVQQGRYSGNSGTISLLLLGEYGETIYAREVLRLTACGTMLPILYHVVEISP